MANSGAFKKGDNRPRKPKGAVNATTKSAKEAFALAFEGIGGVPKLIEWAKDNQQEFFKLYARLIPVDVTSGGETLTVQFVTRASPTDPGA